MVAPFNSDQHHFKEPPKKTRHRHTFVPMELPTIAEDAQPLDPKKTHIAHHLNATTQNTTQVAAAILPKLSLQSAIELVQKDGMHLGDLDNHMQNNVNVAMAATQQNGLALQFVSAEIEQYPDIALAALKQNKKARSYLDINLTHREIINIAKELEYKSEEEGVCAGIVFMGVQALLLEDMETFDTRLFMLALMIQKYKDDKPSLYKAIQEDPNLLPFFEGIELYLQADEHPDLFGKEHILSGQTDTTFIPFVSNLVLPQKLVNKGGLEQATLCTGMYTTDELIKYLNSLKTVCSSDVPLAVVLRAENHTIMITYKPETNTWLFLNANQILKRSVADTDTLASAIFSAFFPKGPPPDRVLPLHTQIYTTKQEAKSHALQKKLKTWKESKDFQEVHCITPQKLQMNDAIWLRNAIEYIDTNTLKALLKAGADPNTRFTEGNTPLLLTVTKHAPKMVDVLVKAGADINLCAPDGCSPLMLSASMNDVKTTQALLKAKADPNLHLLEGGTALMIAVEKSHPKIVEILLRAGADRKALLPNGQTILEFAYEKKDLNVIKLLLRSN